jgi:hypothetical protein
MIGDSWGVPNYSCAFNTLPEVHTEYRLRKLGYNVFNYSLNGGSMIETIEYARHAITKTPIGSDPYLHNGITRKRNTYATEPDQYAEIPIPRYQGQKIDWIVWFHTEALRDINLSTTYLHRFLPIQEMHEICSKAAYKAFSLLVETIGTHVKTAIIGGQSPVNKCLYDYHKPTFIIEDWKKELLGYELPFSYITSNLAMIEQSPNSIEEKLQMLENNKIILDALSYNYRIFFDNCHAGGDAHGELTQKLHNLIQAS